MLVYLFGKLADLANKKEVEVEPQKDSRHLLQVLEDRMPDLKRYNYLLAINEEIVTENRELNPEDEIALLPPFAGG